MAFMGLNQAFLDDAVADPTTKLLFKGFAGSVFPLEAMRALELLLQQRSKFRDQTDVIFTGKVCRLKMQP